MAGIFKMCDIRGIAGVEITEETARQIGGAFAKSYPGEGPVWLGRDARVTSEGLKEAVKEGLLKGGRDVADSGIVSTPVFTWTVSKETADGIMVTASHNPPEDNGFKITRKGRPLHGEKLKALAGIRGELEKNGGQGKAREERPTGRYLESLRGEAMRLGGAGKAGRVVLDIGNGCALLTAAAFLRGLGWDVVEIHDKLDGRFPCRDPNPNKTGALDALGEKVLEMEAAFGVGFDGDGDRACFVDEKGRPLGPEKAILFLLSGLVRQNSRVVYDMKCSMKIPEYVFHCGGKAVMERSGYAFMREAMEREKASFGAELSGHYFYGCWGGRDDALWTVYLFGRLLGDQDLSLSRRIAALPDVFVSPDIRVDCEEGKADEILKKVRRRFEKEGEISSLDGVRVAFEDGWALLRKSVTEPAVTLRFEGRDVEGLRDVMSRVLREVPEWREAAWTALGREEYEVS